MNVTHTSVGLAVVSLTCAHDECLNRSVALKGDALHHQRIVVARTDTSGTDS